MAITWKQIDTNGNGYVDGNEAQKAKEKGAKNVWNSMTEEDYNKNITRNSKLNSIYNTNRNSCENEITQKVTINIPLDGIEGAEYILLRKDHQQYLKEESILCYNCAKELLQKQLAKKEAEFNNKYGILDSIRNFLSDYGVCNKQEGYLSLKNEIDKLKQKIENMDNELKRHVDAPLWRFQ